MVQSKVYSYFLFIAFMIFCSCNSTKFLTDKQCLLKENNFVYDDFHTSLPRYNTNLNLDQLVLQKPNTRKFFTPKEYHYYAHSQPDDSSRWDRFMLRFFSEPPSIIDSLKINQSAKLIKNYFAVNKGFFQASVTYKIKEKDKKCEVDYVIKMNNRYTINKISYFSRDTSVLREILKDTANAILKKGDFIDYDLFIFEKNRITNQLQDLGYADFLPTYVDVKGDSTGLKEAIDIFIDILPPYRKENHRQYRVGEIKVFTDYYPKQDTFFLESSDIKGVEFLRESSDWVVKPERISENIFMKPGVLTNKSDRVGTYQKLISQNAYKFVGINSRFDVADSNVINYDIQLTPHNHKWQFDGGSDIYYSTSPQFANLLGLSVNSRLVNRNAFGGNEKYTLSGDISTELSFNAKTNDTGRTLVKARTFGYGLNNELEYSRFIPYLGLQNLLNRSKLVSRNGEIITSIMSTNFNLGFNVAKILDYYSVNSIRSSFGYRISNGGRSTFSLNPLEFSLNDYEQGRLFETISSNSPQLSLSFVDNFFTSFIFGKFLSINNKTLGKGRSQMSHITSLEVSGLEVFFVNKLYNSLSSNTGYWKPFNGSFDFSKFVRFEYDNRFNVLIGKDKSVAFRANAGVIIPFGDNKYNPYIRQFNVGGPNSLRGWLPRQLIGGYVDNKANIFYANQGDVKLELNSEFRFGIYDILDGAFFVDAGNVWMLKNDIPNTVISSNFYNQIAVASGIGLRFDFDFFILRIDSGFKVRNPFEDAEGKYWQSFGNVLRQFPGNIQAGINYPF
jgi:outer membrane protein insertion porin family